MILDPREKAVCDCGNDKYFIVYKIEELGRPPVLFTHIPENYYLSRMNFKVECLECGAEFDCIEVNEEVVKHSYAFGHYDCERLRDDRDYYRAVKEVELFEI